MASGAEIHLGEVTANYNTENDWFGEIVMHMGLDQAAACLNGAE